MAWRKKGIGFLFLILLIGIIIGTAVGEIIGLLLPEGLVKEFFIRSVSFGFGPTEVDLNVLRFNIGFYLKANIISVIGVMFAAYLFRWY